jgi:hypothetical protein
MLHAIEKKINYFISSNWQRQKRLIRNVVSVEELII